MCDPASTPLRHPKHTYAPKYVSDSEESTQSDDRSSDVGDLTLVAEFDDLMRLFRMKRNDKVEDTFLNFVSVTLEHKKRFSEMKEECIRLQNLLANKSQETSDLESKLHHARKLLDKEKKQSRRLADERNMLEAQIEQVREFLFRDSRMKWTEDAREKLSFLHNKGGQCWDPNTDEAERPILNTIKEVNSTGSLLSDLNYSVSEDDLEISLNSNHAWKKHRPSIASQLMPAPKKRRSSDNKVVEITNSDSVRATTTLTVPKHGPITATSIIESIPTNDGEGLATQKERCPNSNIIYNMWQNNNDNKAQKPAMRQHNLQAKTIVMPDICGPCEKRICFGKTSLKCKDCRTSCHPECKKNLPLPCIPYVSTPTQKNVLNLIGDYAPTIPPMIPALIVHCLREIESRGLHEIGLYRIPGSERDVKQLKEKFLKGRGCPSLSQVDINVICGTVKDFLRNLHEPLVTLSLRPKFIDCVESKEEGVQTGLYKLISKLPQPNRDTMAYLILHLRRVSESKECKMPISNLSMVFGPTIVGFSGLDLEPSMLISETRQQHKVMENLMNLPVDYWSTFIEVQDQVSTPKLQQTPSTDSLLRTPGKPLFTPYSEYHSRRMKRKQKFFPTPPNCRK